MGDGIFYGAIVAVGLGLAVTFTLMNRTIEKQNAEIAILRADVETARKNFERLSAWQAETEALMQGHAQAAQKQEAEFRSLRAKVKDAYKSKEVQDWGSQPVPLAVRSLLEERKDGGK